MKYKKKILKTIDTFKYLPKAITFIFQNPFVLKYLLVSSSLILAFIIISFFVIVLILTPRLSSVNTLISTSYEFAVFVKLISLIISSVLAVGFVVASFNITSFSIISAIYTNLIARVYKRIYHETYYSGGFLKDLKIAFLFFFKQGLLSILILLFSTVLNFIPVIGGYIFVILNIFQLILFTGVNLFEPSLVKYDIQFRNKIMFILSNFHLWPYLWICGFLSSIPILNIFTIPLFIVSSGLIAKEEFDISDEKKINLKDE